MLFSSSRLASLLIVLSLLILTPLAARAGDAGCVPAAVPASTTGATVLGNGTPGSVTTAQIQAALNAGGPIVFDLGPNPVTIALDAELVATRAAVLDGGGLVTLDGGGARRVLRIDNPSNLTYTLTLQHLGIRGGATPGGSGAGVYKPSGGPWQAVSLDVVGCWFEDNIAITTAQDDGGGALYAVGMDRVAIDGSSFIGNRGSNGGAVYSLGSKTLEITGSVFDDNRATGTDGNPGNGGNGGALGVDGAERTVRLCDVRIENSRANAFGAGFFSVMYDAASLTRFEAVTFAGNVNPSDTFGFAGGAYLQGGPFEIERSSFVGNAARGVGALFLGPGASGTIVNSTFQGNIARASLAGGLSIDSSVTVSIVNSTIVENEAPCDVCFAAGISNSAGNGITLQNTILADNVGGNVFNPWNIRHPVADGGGNLQFPRERPNGQQEPAATPTVLWLDPQLDPPAMNGGPTPTMALPATSPAVDAGVSAGAPPIDQRGVARDALVDIGAYELGVLFADGFETGDLTAWSGP
ncbi:MAG: choice-of-anchor Q domain-containing protein [Acidobacteriota bacterium]